MMKYKAVQITDSCLGCYSILDKNERVVVGLLDKQDAIAIVQALNRNELWGKMEEAARIARNLTHIKFCRKRALISGCHDKCKNLTDILAKIDALGGG